MKRIKVLSMFLLVAMMATVLVGCSKDDDANFDLNSYIIGSWHSYKGSVFIMGGQYAGTSNTVTVEKTGQYSDWYYEIKFLDANRATFSAYKQDENGVSNWEQEEITYSINGSAVRLKDSDGETIDLIFDEKDNSLCLQVSITKDDVPYKVAIYLRK